MPIRVKTTPTDPSVTSLPMAQRLPMNRNEVRVSLKLWALQGIDAMNYF